MRDGEYDEELELDSVLARLEDELDNLASKQTFKPFEVVSPKYVTSIFYTCKKQLTFCIGTISILRHHC